MYRIYSKDGSVYKNQDCEGSRQLCNTTRFVEDIVVEGPLVYPENYPSSDFAQLVYKNLLANYITYGEIANALSISWNKDIINGPPGRKEEAEELIDYIKGKVSFGEQSFTATRVTKFDFARGNKEDMVSSAIIVNDFSSIKEASKPFDLEVVDPNECQTVIQRNDRGCDYDDTYATSKDFLNRWNTELTAHSIKVKGHEVNVQYYRVMHHILYGRVFTNPYLPYFDFVQYPSDRTLTDVTIDDQPLVEVDIVSCAPKMLFEIAGQTLEWDDIYYAKKDTDLRKAYKQATQFLLNKTWSRNIDNKVIYGVRKSLGSSGNPSDPKQAYFVMRRRLQPASGFITNKTWMVTSLLESLLLMNVVEKAYTHHIPILTKHDAWFVRQPDLDTVKEFLIEAYNKLTGEDPVIKTKRG